MNDGSSLGAGPGDSKGQLPPNAAAARLYAPRLTETSGEETRVRSQVRAGGPAAMTQERGAPDRTSASRVPYYEVVGDYSKQAEEALAREEVPPAYRATVRDYFNALQPASKGSTKP